MNPKHPQLTPEQDAKIRQGCWYELMKGAFTVLLVIVFVYGLPFLGGAASTAVFVFNLLGMLVVAQWITGLIYPQDPLTALRNEIKEKQ